MYYNAPWELKSGDDVRIHKILVGIAETEAKTITFNLNALAKSYSIIHADNVVYISMPRSFYRFISEIIKWKNHHDLNPLIKITHYIDELLTAIKLRKELAKAPIVMVFGSMSLFSFVTRLLFKLKNVVIVYDPLANYAQTLHLRSRNSLIGLLKYGLYLALHKLQIRSSDIIVYPSKTDLDNAKRMFKPAGTLIIPNPLPICFDSVEEYVNLRSKRSDFDKVYFVLLAGGRGGGNEEAVKITIEVFNELPSRKFKLIITGPWLDLKRFVKNPSIELMGVVPKEKLKEILAICDYGLAPVFSHVAGTFLKVLAYIASGLHIIATPQSLQGIDSSPLRGRRVFIIRNINEYKNAVRKAIMSRPCVKTRRIITCHESNALLRRYVEELINYVRTHHDVRNVYH